MGRRYCQRPQPGHMKKRRKEAWLSIRQGVSCFLLCFAENEKKFSRSPYFDRRRRVERRGTRQRQEQFPFLAEPSTDCVSTIWGCNGQLDPARRPPAGGR